jgi:hypothetical protein
MPDTMTPSSEYEQAPDLVSIPNSESRSSKVSSLLHKCFSFPALLGAVLVGVTFEIDRPLRLDPDTWWHIKYGTTILQTGHWPTVDKWSFTASGMPGAAYEWGGEVITALAYRWGGLRGMDVLLITLTSIIVLLLYYFAWLRCRNSKAAFAATILIYPVAALCFTLRPQLFGYIFLLITLISLERYRQGEQKSLWILPPLFLAWVNTHGSFTLGFMVLGLYWLSGLKDISTGRLTSVRWRPEQRLHLELVGLLSVAVLPFTPYGTRLAAVPLEYANSLPLNLSDIIEWQPLSANLWEAKLLLLLLFAFIVAQIVFHFRYRIEEFGLFLLVAYLTFVHFRFAIVYAIIFAPLAAEILVRWMPTYDPKVDKPGINALLMIAVAIGMVWFLPSQNALAKNVARTYPVDAVRYLKAHPIPGHMFNDYSYGGYLVWTMAPETKVFIDGRGNIYEPTGVFLAYTDVVSLKPDTMAVLQCYQVNYCLIPQDSALATLLTASSGWKEVYKDSLSAIFVRDGTSKNNANRTDLAEPQHKAQMGGKKSSTL